MYLIVERRTRDMSRKESRPVPGYGASMRLVARKSDRTVMVGKADGLVFAGRAEALCLAHVLRATLTAWPASAPQGSGAAGEQRKAVKAQERK